jgi:hypothetical protein
MTARTAPAHWRAVDAPFAVDAWRPVPGRCSRCGQRAWRGTIRWWHQGARCQATYRHAPEFLPD